MSWNYRVVRMAENWCVIKEVFYATDGRPEAWTDTVVSGETEEDIRWALTHMLEALDKPTLAIDECGKFVFSER